MDPKRATISNFQFPSYLQKRHKRIVFGGYDCLDIITLNDVRGHLLLNIISFLPKFVLTFSIRDQAISYHVSLDMAYEEIPQIKALLIFQKIFNLNQT